MKDFLENIVKHIVDAPDKVVIDSHEENGKTVFIITVDDADMGRVIGKEGRVINSIRNIMRVMAIRQNTRIRIDIADNRGEEVGSAPVEATETVGEPEAEVESTTNTTVNDFVGQPDDSSAEVTIVDNTKKK